MAVECKHTDCNRDFDTEHAMKTHFGLVHESEPANCPTCGRHFSTRFGMKIHHTKSHGESIAGVTLTCEVCGDEYEERPGREDRSRFCSRDCFGRWRQTAFEGDGSPKYNSRTVECDFCGTPIVRKKAELERGPRNFCSVECQNRWQKDSGHMAGPNSPRWKGDRAMHRRNYGDDWQGVRKAVLEKDGYRCVACRASEEDTNREMDVHHIIPVMEFETPARANEMENLVSLCRSCHMKWEGIPLRPQKA